jgi:hypothetical protein
MRVTTNSIILIDVMIRNKIFYQTTTRVVELGYLDNFAQVMNTAVKCTCVHSGSGNLPQCQADGLNSFSTSAKQTVLLHINQQTILTQTRSQIQHIFILHAGKGVVSHRCKC